MPRHLVTGGAGFIGSHIARGLIKNGGEVRILDNFSSGKRENIEDIMHRIELIEGDICDYKIVEKAVRDVDYVFHYAALPYVALSIEEPVKTVNVNNIGTINLLEASRQTNVKKFIFASSSAIYGDTKTLPSPENLLPFPLSPYAITKLSCEYYCRFYYSTYGLKTVCFRYFNVFGPNQNLKSVYGAVIPIFINSILNDKRPTIYGDGYQTRDFIYVENVVDINLLSLKIDNIDGKVVNVCQGREINLFEIVDTINRILGKSVKPIFADRRPCDVHSSWGENKKLKSVLEYDICVSFEEGIRKTVEWYRKQKFPMDTDRNLYH